ncbi:MAG: hypothetical protein C4335_12955 [Armatimonadota bacterium]
MEKHAKTAVPICALSALLWRSTALLSIALVASGCSLLLRSTGATAPTPPPQAAAAGFTKLTFSDEFNSISTIDVNATGLPGYKWYVDRPFGWPVVQRSEYRICNGVLVITQQGSSYANWGSATYSVKGKTGRAFRYGYIEARMRFDPALGPNSDGWPSFWMLSLSHTLGSNDSRYSELDIFEAYTGGYAEYKRAFVGTLHEWQQKPTLVHYQNANNWTPLPHVDFGKWHTYGVLWKPGEVTWYFDGTALQTQRYSANGYPEPQTNPISPIGTFSIIDSEDLVLILGSGVSWPLYVDYVRVWQKDR